MHQNYREIPSPLQALWDVIDTHLATTPSVFRMIYRSGGFVIITLTLIGPYALASALGQSTVRRMIAGGWFSLCGCITGLHIRVRGKPNRQGGTLYVANHVSYLDVIVLGKLLDTRFIAKNDVANWPLFGLLAKLASTLFVTRIARHSAKDSEAISAALENGDQLLMFPEGTSSDGRRVLPFKSALFSAIGSNRSHENLFVQPVSIAYTSYADGRALTGSLRDLYAWHGEMTLFGHLMTVFGLKGACVEVTFSPSIRPSVFSNRKQLAAACETAVRRGLNPRQPTETSGPLASSSSSIHVQKTHQTI